MAIFERCLNGICLLGWRNRWGTRDGWVSIYLVEVVYAIRALTSADSKCAQGHGKRVLQPSSEVLFVQETQQPNLSRVKCAA